MGSLSALYEQLEAEGEANPSWESTKSMVKVSLSLLGNAACFSTERRKEVMKH